MEQCDKYTCFRCVLGRGHEGDCNAGLQPKMVATARREGMIAGLERALVMLDDDGEYHQAGRIHAEIERLKGEA